MRRVAALAALLIAAAGCGGGSAPPVVSDAAVVRAPGVARAVPELAPEAIAARAADDARFALALQPHLAAADANLVWSPYSVTQAFALAYAGARGETREQMARALRLGSDPHPALNALDRAIESRARDGVAISTASAAWGLPRYPWEREFLEVLARHHGAGMRTVDFVGDPERAAQAIDAWVREQTRGKIRDLFTARDFNDLSRLVLANAAYLKARWLTGFDPRETRERPFHAPGGTVGVPTMHRDLDATTAAGDGWQAIELPYKGRRLAMLVVVPDDGDVAGVEGRLDELAGRLEPEYVRLALPRFRVESTVDLAVPLKRLGVRDAFDAAAADFTGMAGTEELFVAKARHKAFVEVDEHGTEAAAATGMIVEAVSARPPARPFAVDRPFAFAIRDRPTGAVLFSGRVTRP